MHLTRKGRGSGGIGKAQFSTAIEPETNKARQEDGMKKARKVPKLKVTDISAARRLKWEKLIRSLLKEGTVMAAARVARVGRRTAHEWLRDPKFNALLRETSRSVTVEVGIELMGSAVAAVRALRAIVDGT